MFILQWMSPILLFGRLYIIKLPHSLHTLLGDWSK